MCEIDFHWIETPNQWPYLRETFILAERPRAKPNIGGGLLVGYGIVDNSARVGTAYQRRILYLENRDYPLDKYGPYNPESEQFLGWPSESVCPLSVAKGERSRNISRISRAEALRRVALTGRSVMSCTACSSMTRIA